MSLAAFTVTIQQALTAQPTKYHTTGGGLSDPTSAVAPTTATVAADIATLVADGATPTQAHVTTLNTDWGTFLTAENLYRTAAGSVLGGDPLDAVLLLDTSKISTINQLKSALESLLRSATASGKFTA